MPEGMGFGPFLNGVGVVGICVFIAYLVLTDRLVPGRRLRRAEAEAERWQNIALEALRVSATAIVPAAESVHAVVSNLPDPSKESGGSP